MPLEPQASLAAWIGDGASTPLLPTAAAERPPKFDWSSFWSAYTLLVGGIMGSPLVTVPYALSRVGLATGFLVMCVAGLMNYYTSKLLVDLARVGAGAGQASFEDIGELAFGPQGRRATQGSLLLLLLGSMCCSLAAVRNVLTRGLSALLPAPAVATVCGGGGNLVLAGIILVVILPLALLRRMRQLDAAATVGNAILLLVVGVLVWGSVEKGMPALREAWRAGDEAFFWRPGGGVADAMAVLGFALYIQPQLLPLCNEMPPGVAGTRAMNAALTVTMATAVLLYTVAGAFAFAHFGYSIHEDVLTNLSGPTAAVLDVSTACYLAVCFAPQHFTFRAVLSRLLFGGGALPRGRHVALTLAAVGSAAAVVAATPPDSMEAVFALTGATGVCAACYVLPVVIHLKLAGKPPPRDPLARLSLGSGGDFEGGGVSAPPPSPVQPRGRRRRRSGSGPRRSGRARRSRARQGRTLPPSAPSRKRSRWLSWPGGL
mmetsp:Transcript_61416/g.194401  ORF Transcript_61416/g.194401 Transcript_61416/m.194401 type:complete len:488 (+) Transcript_61416:148-1611(+)